jgi:hypothetical protein
MWALFIGLMVAITLAGTFLIIAAKAEAKEGKMCVLERVDAYTGKKYYELDELRRYDRVGLKWIYIERYATAEDAIRAAYRMHKRNLSQDYKRVVWEKSFSRNEEAMNG